MMRGAPDVTAIRPEIPGVRIVEPFTEDAVEDRAVIGVDDISHYLDPSAEVPPAQIGGADEVLGVPIVFESEDSRVLEKGARAGDDAGSRGEAGKTGTEGADSTDEQVDRDARDRPDRGRR